MMGFEPEKLDREWELEGNERLFRRLPRGRTSSQRKEMSKGGMITLI
jgi:hypothetical protein